MGMQLEACKHIVQQGLEDTFYVVDLGNVQRMYKVRTLRGRKVWGVFTLAFAHNTVTDTALRPGCCSPYWECKNVVR